MADLVLGLAKTVVEGTMTAVRSAMEEDEKLHKSVQRDLMLISDEFEMMHSFLSNAAANSDGVVVTDEVSRTCVRQVRDMALDVEDCIEEVVHLDNDPGWWRRLLPRKLAAAGPVVALDDAVARVELLKTRIEAMGQRNMRYGTGGSSSSKAAVDQELMDVANNMMMTTTIGTAAEKKGGGPVDLVTLISKQQEDAAAAPAPLRVIAVVGEAAGTMSVIKKAYDDPTARAKFGCRAWVKLMHPFSPHEFIRSLLAQFCDTYCRAPSSSSSSSGVVDLPEPMDITVSKEDQLIKVMKQLMCNERYLVVLENVPTIVDWEAVRVYLPDKRNGSCILVHTQLVEVARLCVGDPHRRSEVQNYWAAAPTVYAFFKEDAAQGESSVQQTSAEEEYENLPEEYRDIPEKFLAVLMVIQIMYSNLLARGEADVFSVWGVAGAGKSYLVRAIYTASKDSFERSGWVNIPRPFDLSELSQSLLLDMHSGSSDQYNTSSNPIQECRQVLRNHKCFVVLDGLQSKQEWDCINASLASGGCQKTTKFIVITNEESVATYCATTNRAVRNVRGLEAGYAFELFHKKVQKKACRSDLKPELIEKAKLVIHKCGGIPKVIVAIADAVADRLDAPKTVAAAKEGGFFSRFFRDVADAVWRGGTDAAAHHLLDDMLLSGRFMPILETNPAFGSSLHGLFAWLRSYFRSCPDYLKPCIFYLSVFPMNHQIRRRRLLRRWIAESYSSTSSSDNRESSTEEEFFHRLVKLSMIQPLGLPEADETVGEISLSGVCVEPVRVPLCRVNAFFHEFIMSRSMEENLVFALEGNGNGGGGGGRRHLGVQSSWVRDRSMFESMDLSRLRSLTVFGGWEPFFVSPKMKVLRVLDLEDAEGVKDDDLEQIVELLRRLKFLSLRRCRDVTRLPGSVGRRLKHLQTLDIRDTAIRELPKSAVNLKKLQYIRAGSTSTTVPLDSSLLPTPAAAEASPSPPLDSSPLPPPEAAAAEASPSPPLSKRKPSSMSCRPLATMVVSKLRRRMQVQGQGTQQRGYGSGINVPKEVIGHLGSLDTLGVVNISSKAILKELKGLSKLRKLGVSGIGNNNRKEFFDAISGLRLLESLSVQFDRNPVDGCFDDDTTTLPNSLKSLKLYGLEGKLSAWLKRFPHVRKLNLQMTTGGPLPPEEIDFLDELTELRILRLGLAEVQDRQLHLSCRCKQLYFLEITCNSTFKALSFGSMSVEVLKIRCSSVSSSLKFSGLESLSDLREVQLSGSYEDGFRHNLQSQLEEHEKRPALHTEEEPNPST